MMGEQESSDHPRSPAFEEVWAILQESAKLHKEWQAEAEKRQAEAAEQKAKADKWQEEADKRHKEWLAEQQAEAAKRKAEADKRQEEADKRHKEWLAEQQAEDAKRKEEADERMKKIDKAVAEANRSVAKLGDRFGEMVEYLVVPDLVDKFREFGFVFTKAYLETTIKDKKNHIIAEVDITLENGDKVMLVEVKSKPTTKDITDHVDRMEKLRRHADLHGDKRKYLGAIAGMVIKDNERNFALKQGFFLLEPSGETFVIIPPEGEPRTW